MRDVGASGTAGRINKGDGQFRIYKYKPRLLLLLLSPDIFEKGGRSHTHTHTTTSISHRLSLFASSTRFPVSRQRPARHPSSSSLCHRLHIQYDALFLRIRRDSSYTCGCNQEEDYHYLIPARTRISKEYFSEKQRNPVIFLLLVRRQQSLLGRILMRGSILCASDSGCGSLKNTIASRPRFLHVSSLLLAGNGEKTRREATTAVVVPVGPRHARPSSSFRHHQHKRNNTKERGHTHTQKKRATL